MTRTTHWAHLAALLCLIAGAADTSPLAAQNAAPSAAEPDLPARIPLELDMDPADRLSLSWFGSCCYQREFTEDPPEIARVVPPLVGEHRVFTVLELADSRIAMSFEDLEEGREKGGRLLVRADLDQDGDLTDDPVHHCHRDASCGPFEAGLRHGAGTAPYAFAIRLFAIGDDSESREILWYWRAVALTGTFAGREIVVIDNDTNGRYDDPEDIVVFDLDGDGRLDGGHDGRERLPRDAPFDREGETLLVTGVDPVAMTLEVDRAPRVSSIHRVLDIQSGQPVAGARVTTYPGELSGVTDTSGRTTIERPGGRIGHLTAVADGYWSAVHGPGQRAGEELDRILLAPGPCRRTGMHWCGQESLGASSMTNSHLDLDTGVVGPRVGETPGPEDIGWYVPPGGLYLSASGEAGLAVLGNVDLDTVTPAHLRTLTFDEERVYGNADCGHRVERTRDPLLGRGTVLGVRTQEGRLGKIRIDDCDSRLDLSWVIYDGDSPEGGTEAEARPPVPVAAPPPPERPMQVGKEVVPPVRTYSPAPQYTNEAREARLQGVVIVQVIIDTQGRVTDIKILKGLGMGLDEATIETMSRWRFRPATLNGEPVTVYYNMTVNFRLE